MKSSITHDDLCDYVSNQINNIFPDRAKISSSDIKPYINEAMERVQLSKVIQLCGLGWGSICL